jgi:molecular chaperone HscB
MSNPFEILNLEQSYALDLQLLEKRYFEAQKKSHPDQFSNATTHEKAQAILKSTAINRAYLMLKNPLLRAEYLLKAAGLEPLSHDPSFLNIVMEWNERRERGEDLTLGLLDQKKILMKALEDSFADRDYEKARSVFYKLTYIQKLLRKRSDRE